MRKIMNWKKKNIEQIVIVHKFFHYENLPTEPNTILGTISITVVTSVLATREPWEPRILWKTSSGNVRSKTIIVIESTLKSVLTKRNGCEGKDKFLDARVKNNNVRKNAKGGNGAELNHKFWKKAGSTQNAFNLNCASSNKHHTATEHSFRKCHRIFVYSGKKF